MNHIYRLIYSDLTRTWVAVAEIARGRGKRSSGTVGHTPRLGGTGGAGGAAGLTRNIGVKILAASLALIGAPVHALDVNALPKGGSVVAGSAAISQSANTLTVQQSSQRAAINWQSFNIGAAATVNFVQPNASAVALNRITGNEASQIYGKLNANGQVFFSNPNGMLFARGAEVNVAGIIATTLNISNADFMAGNYRFTDPGNGSIRNEGLINALGSIALIGNTVQNTGQLIATTATLAAGNTVAVDLTNDGLIRARVVDPVLRANIENSGSISAAQITLTTGQARETLDRVVNNSGVIRATGLAMVNGEIVLEGGRVLNSGRLDASNNSGKGGTVQVLGREIDLAPASVITASGGGGGGNIVVLGDMSGGAVKVAGTLDASSANGDGGFIETSAAHVNIANDVTITTKAPLGLSGTWLIDPFDFTIAATGGDITGATLTSLLGTNSVVISTAAGTNSSTNLYATTAGNGDIFVNDVVSWAANTLTLSADRNININANLNASGTASLELEYGKASNTSNYILNNGAQVNLPAGNHFSTKLGLNGAVKSYTVISSPGAAGSTTATDLQGMSGNLTLNYALGGNIGATPTSSWNAGAGFAPVGPDSVSPFTGSFDGLGHTISNLTINRPGEVNLGLFGYTTGGTTGAAIRNVGLVGGSVSGYGSVGGLVGYNGSRISNSYSTATVSGVIGGQFVGGLVGYNSATIKNSFATGNVSGGGHVGGLVGYNDCSGCPGSQGIIANSYATGSVSGLSSVGGLVGTSNFGSSIGNSYATGSANGGQEVGGLVGQSDRIFVGNSYATGRVSGSSSVGGLLGSVGQGFSGGNNFWDTETTLQATPVGVPGNITPNRILGLTTAQMMQMASFSSWNTAAPNTIANTGGSGAVWRIYEGHTAPLLVSFLKPLTLTDAPDVAANYNGAAQSGATTATAGVLGAAATGTNAGFYNGYYSTQQGFDISGGNLLINPAQAIISLSGTRAYDGTAIVDHSIFTLSGLVGGQTLALNGAGTVADKNVGVNKPVTLGTLALSDGTGLASNYTFTGGTQTATITQLPSVAWTGGATEPAEQNKWSAAANWFGGAIPDGANVAVVSIPAGVTVTYDAAVGATQLASLTSLGNLTLAGGSLTLGTSVANTSIVKGAILTLSGAQLTVNGSLTADIMRVNSGTLDGRGNLTSADFAQTGGSIAGTLANLNLSSTGNFVLTNSLSALQSLTIGAGGAVIDAMPVGTAPTLIAPKIQLNAGTGIGSAAAPLRLATNDVLGLTSSGVIDVINTPSGPVTFRGMATGSASYVSYGQNGQSMTAIGAIASNGGDIFIDPPTDINLNSSINTSGSGSVHINATGNIIMGPAATISSGTGGVEIKTGGNIMLASVNAGSGAVVIEATSGQIGTSTPGVNNVVAGDLTLTANTGIQLNYIAPAVHVSNNTGTILLLNSSTGVVVSNIPVTVVAVPVTVVPVVEVLVEVRTANQIVSSLIDSFLPVTSQWSAPATTTTFIVTPDSTNTGTQSTSLSTSNTGDGTLSGPGGGNPQPGSKPASGGSSSDNNQPDQNNPPAAKPKTTTQTVIVGNTMVQKPADQVVQGGPKGKGSVLVCRPI